jgi:hypothetical protein
MVRKLIDSALKTAVKSWVNAKFAPYGEVQELLLNTPEHMARVVALFRGEERPISVAVRYEIRGDGIAVTAIDASREWLNTLAQDYVRGRCFPLPQIVILGVSIRDLLANYLR